MFKGKFEKEIERKMQYSARILSRREDGMDTSTFGPFTKEMHLKRRSIEKRGFWNWHGKRGEANNWLLRWFARSGLVGSSRTSKGSFIQRKSTRCRSAPIQRQQNKRKVTSAATIAHRAGWAEESLRRIRFYHPISYSLCLNDCSIITNLGEGLPGNASLAQLQLMGTVRCPTGRMPGGFISSTPGVRLARHAPIPLFGSALITIWGGDCWRHSAIGTQWRPTAPASIRGRSVVVQRWICLQYLHGEPDSG